MRENYWYITPEDYETAAKNGINKRLLYHRVYVYGWSIERAINTKKKGENISSEAFKEAAKKGIDRATVFSRLRHGWSEEKALTTPIGNAGKRVLPEWVYKEADKHNIRYDVVYNRVKRGWDLERACTEKVKSNGRRRK